MFGCSLRYLAELGIVFAKKKDVSVMNLSDAFSSP